MTGATSRRPLHRAWSFLAKPGNERIRSFYARWPRSFPDIPIPYRLPFGSWWLSRRDYLGESLLSATFETAEIAFVSRFLQRGMSVLDIGAHQGFYTLLASKLVGPSGRIISFEPSPRERKRLQTHLWLNRARNVEVVASALGNNDGEADLFLAGNQQSGCNSLRAQVDLTRSAPIRVRITRLDDWVRRNGISADAIALIKMDVEGGELEVLRGGQQLLHGKIRPVILCELEDVRAKAWGYEARAVADYLRSLGFSWFQIGGDGKVGSLPREFASFCGNYVAVPEERLSQIEQGEVSWG